MTTLTAENQKHPDYPYSQEALNERLFFSQLNEHNYHEKMNKWRDLREASFYKKLQSDKSESKENSESTRNPDSTHISTKTVFNYVKQNPHFNEISSLVNKPKLYLPRGGRKGTRVFKKKSNKRRTSKSSRRTSRKYK